VPTFIEAGVGIRQQPMFWWAPSIHLVAALVWSAARIRNCPPVQMITDIPPSGASVYSTDNDGSSARGPLSDLMKVRGDFAPLQW